MPNKDLYNYNYNEQPKTNQNLPGKKVNQQYQDPYYSGNNYNNNAYGNNSYGNNYNYNNGKNNNSFPNQNEVADVKTSVKVIQYYLYR